ncbi:MAG: PKD domain-containing protein, partial [Thermoproteota archaeon]|nr:PKD domain-containing protein [Thermoproteota archaeon]
SLSSNNAIATTKVPAKLVEITYRTNSAPNQTRTGYFILTATAATPRNLGTITGYSLFYEGNSIASSNKTETSSTIPSGSPGLPRPLPTTTTTVLPPQTTPTVPLPAAVRQVFDSFQLIAAPTEPLRVEITSSDTEGVAPATFRFEAHVTGGMEPYSFSWSFGDGSSSRQERGEDDDNTIRHTFDRAGTYNVRVVVTDSTGRTASDSILIRVEAPPPLRGVNIISNATEGVAPATFRFEANVTGGMEPYSFSWSFGDGSGGSSNSQETDDDDNNTIRHTFDRAGTYNVDVTVTDSTGRTAFDNIEINVKEAPVATEQPPNVHNFLDDLIDNLGLT